MNAVSNKQRNTIFGLLGYIEGRVYALGDHDNGSLLLESVLDLQNRLHQVFDEDDVPAREESAQKPHIPTESFRPVIMPPDAPEMPQPEANEPIAAGEVGNDERPRGGHRWTDEQRQAASNKRREFVLKRGPLIPESELSSIEFRFGDGDSFDKIGKSYGCSGTSVRNFLTKHGIDPRRNPPGARAGGRPPLAEEELRLIIDEKAKGTPSREIGVMLDRSQHAIDQKYSDLKKAGRVPEEHVSAEALQDKKRRQNALVSTKMKEFHARTREAENHDKNLDEDGWPEPVTPEKVMSLDVRPDERAETIAALIAAIPEGIKDGVVPKSDITKTLLLLESLPMSTVAERLGVKVFSIDSCLKRYGIDYRTLPAGRSKSRTDVEDSRPRMKFRTKIVRDTWGNEKEVDVPLPIRKYKDPDTGAKVTQYPPGYAIGTHPPRNVSVKGGA